MTFLSWMVTAICGAWLSSLVRVISAVALFSASSVALIWSLPASETLSQELRVLADPSVGVKVRAMVQVADLSSFQVATDLSPILSSLPEMVTAGPAMTFTVLAETVMVGALVSLAGVGGVGSIGSSPPQETARETARSAARRFPVKPGMTFLRFRVKPGMTEVRWNQRIVFCVSWDFPAEETWFGG